MWQEVREYRVNVGEDVGAHVTTLYRRGGGWWSVAVTALRDVRPTTHWRRRADAENAAAWEAVALADMERKRCAASEWCDAECADPYTNPYDAAHGVRVQVVDSESGMEVDGLDL